MRSTRTFSLFVGFGLGSLICGEVLQLGYVAALGAFAAVEFAAALLSLALFRSEVPTIPAFKPVA